ncbi:AMIN-like domain-containing (lipo)protein [Trujillonella endophytica]|uniref:AMIN-like domain-containing protein n=1 Tax=Trujillonella endophytica TaxID=673521 RepID=A0A1H8SZZ7_9ACTN|nr:hypothetical protein [Trujillella endophytica]SEO84370.1 hypothetical protein SAMN05660991_01968 [Trujillella endophytica]
MVRALPDGRTRNRARGVLVVVLLLGGLVACGGDDDGDGDDSGADATPSSSAAAPSPTDADGDDGTGDDGGSDGGDGTGSPQPPFPADTRPDTQDASGDALGNVTDIRIGRHEGYDRVVLEFEGTGTPGWDVRYTDQPARQGSGEPVDLAGEAALQVTVTGVGYPPDTGIVEYSGPPRLSAADTEVVTEVFFDGTFEGVTAVLAGTRAEVPFRVYLLEAPARIVIEVADPA